MRLALALLSLVVSPVAAAGERRAPTLYGDVELKSSWRARHDLLSLVPQQWAVAYRVAAQTQASASWFTFAAFWDTGGTWPAHQTIRVTLREGGALEAATIMAMSPRPECRPLALGEVTRELKPHDLERGRTRGRVGIVLLVSFAEPGLGLGDITDVEVRPRSPSPARPGPAPRGGSP